MVTKGLRVARTVYADMEVAAHLHLNHSVSVPHEVDISAVLMAATARVRGSKSFQPVHLRSRASREREREEEEQEEQDREILKER
ncbi:unnamed protein product [Cylicostephanus goldi]|uniref:Uncharacterized protein n=1 Tax=Cylicostephanus goldi TaxID=71465 RepID=A0A3P7MQ64_CYLGO|nr:unnamed protein product [Cylicostephanus goldi]